MFDWLIRTPQFDPDHPRWTKYFETADTLAALFSGLTGFQIANAPESFFGERGVASAAVGGLPSADRGDSKFAQMATAVWICTNTLPLFREVAQVLDHKNLTGKLNPSELVKNIVEFLKTETQQLSTEDQARYLAELMIAVGVGLSPADSDWRNLTKELVLLQAELPERLGGATPLVGWAVGIETGASDLSINERELSLAAILKSHDDLVGFDFNRWAYLLLRLELFRSATPIAKWAFEQSQASHYFPTEVRSVTSPDMLAYSRASAADTYAWSLCYEGRPHEALPLFVDALRPLERGSDDWCEVQYHRAHAASLSGRSAELNEIITDICSAAPDNHWTKRAVQLLGNVQARDNKDSVALPHYDVVISFAGEDRQIANEIAQKLRKEGTLVFYDDFERATLWGQDLYQYLSDIYKNRGKFCILLVSRHYARKRWTKVECRAAQARAFLQDEPYLLPVRIDETELPGLLPTVGYLSLDGDGVDGIVTAVRMKLTSY